MSDPVPSGGSTPFPRATSARAAAHAAASDPPRPPGDAAVVGQQAEEPVGERELYELAALLSRCASVLGGLPIALRVELGGALHALERHLAERAGS